MFEFSAGKIETNAIWWRRFWKSLASNAKQNYEIIIQDLVLVEYKSLSRYFVTPENVVRKLFWKAKFNKKI